MGESRAESGLCSFLYPRALTEKAKPVFTRIETEQRFHKSAEIGSGRNSSAKRSAYENTK